MLLRWQRIFSLLRSIISLVLIVIVVIATSLVLEVGGAFMFVGRTIVLISSQRLVNVSRGELVELLVVPKYYHRHIDRTQHRQFVSFLEQAALALEKRHGPVAIILDGSDFDLPATHVGIGRSNVLRASCSRASDELRPWSATLDSDGMLRRMKHTESVQPPDHSFVVWPLTKRSLS